MTWDPYCTPPEVTPLARLGQLWKHEAVTHPSTNIGTPCLTSVISQELVYPKCYVLAFKWWLIYTWEGYSYTHYQRTTMYFTILPLCILQLYPYILYKYYQYIFYNLNTLCFNILPHYTLHNYHYMLYKNTLIYTLQ